MTGNPMKQLRQRTEDERVRLAEGQRPKPRFQNPVQRTAVRALAGFFALMFALTLLSRAADGITVAQVQAKSPGTGVLTQRLEVSGGLEALGDLPLTLPAGIQIQSVTAEKGQRVAEGDVLLTLDPVGLQRTIEKLESEIHILDLKLAGTQKGQSAADTEAILAAQQALTAAQEDYDRLAGSRERTEGRTEEDMRTNLEDYDKAVAGLRKAEDKARDALIKAAQEKVDAAQKSLDSVKESAESAIDSAKGQVQSAEDAQHSYSESYSKSVEGVSRAKERLSELQQRLSDLMEAGASEGEIQAAQDAVNAAQEAVDGAEWNMQSYNYSNTIELRRAKDNLKKVQEKQDAKIKAAEAEVKKAEDELTEVRNRTDLSEEPAVVTAQAAVDAAEDRLKTAQRGIEDAAVATDDQLFEAKRKIETAERAVAEAQRKAEETARTDADSRRQAEIERLGYVSERREKTQTLEELRRVAQAGGVLTAPVAGTVKTIVETAGRTQDGVQVAVLSRSDQGIVFKGKVDQETAEKLVVGDEGELSYTQDGTSKTVKCKVTGIGTADEKGEVTVTAELPEGTYASGITGKLTVTRRSEQYPSTLPLGALRSDQDGDYVLVVREKQTVMGAEQTVERVTVKVLEQDSENMAVESSLLNSDLVVVQTNKPISHGDRVRISEA